MAPEVGKKGTRARGTYKESKASRCRTASEAAWAILALDGPQASRVRSCLIRATFDSRLALRWEESEPAFAGPAPIQGRDWPQRARGSAG